MLWGKSTTDSLGLRKGKFGNTQPYVIRDVGQRWNLSNSPVVGNNVELIRGGLVLVSREQPI